MTVTANARSEARRLVARYLRNPENENNQPKGGDYGPNFPIDSWALLTESKVVNVDANAKRDRVTWQAVEVS